MYPANKDWDKEIMGHQNKCSSLQCIRCNNADMLQVERSSNYVRCGCADSKNYGTWSFGGVYMPAEECQNFSEVVDNQRKRMVNLAWELSCDRKLEWLDTYPLAKPPPNSRPVIIERCLPHNSPFPEVERNGS